MGLRLVYSNLGRSIVYNLYSISSYLVDFLFQLVTPTASQIHAKMEEFVKCWEIPLSVFVLRDLEDLNVQVRIQYLV